MNKDIDAKALEAARNFKKAEAELLEMIIQVDNHKVYYDFGYSSLFQYVVGRLQLSESQTSAFIAVARKSQEVPELKHEIARGNLTINKAKRITGVINQSNRDQWIELAKTSPQRKVEREVALAVPEKVNRSRMTYLSPNEVSKEKAICSVRSPKVKLEMTVEERTMLKLRRAQDLLSQKRRGSANLENTLLKVLDEYLMRNDPVEKAKRQKKRGKLQICNTDTKQEGVENKGVRNNKGKADDEQANLVNKSTRNQKDNTDKAVNGTNEKSPNDKGKVTCSKNLHFSRNVKAQAKRKPISANTKHQVMLRDEGRCTFIDSNGHRCKSKRYIEVHHKTPVAKGGSNSVNNLQLLCSGHHKAMHRALAGN